MNNTVEHRLLSIKQKLKENNLTITCADKGKTVVIIELQNKIMEFNIESGLKGMAKHPTPKYQKYVKEMVKIYKPIIDRLSQYRYIKMNPQAPKLNILIKLHKETQPIRSV
jgi:hypothetical protein